MSRRKQTRSSAKQKLSEMIIEIADGFLVGEDLAEQQNRLNVACAAWNIACGSPSNRQKQFELYANGYRRCNPHVSEADMADILKDIELLVAKKVAMFPDDRRQIVNARVVDIGGGKTRIDVVSATIQ